MGEARLSAGNRGEINSFARRRAMQQGRAVAGLMVVAMFVAMSMVSRPAWAHAALVKSSPASRAELHRSPTRIQLWFNERLEAKFSSFTLTNAKGQPVELGAVTVPSDDPKSLSAEVKPLAPGRYVVKYRVLSTDGHIVENQFSFTVHQ
jgi:copper resistance protein C